MECIITCTHSEELVTAIHVALFIMIMYTLVQRMYSSSAFEILALFSTSSKCKWQQHNIKLKSISQQKWQTLNNYHSFYWCRFERLLPLHSTCNISVLKERPIRVGCSGAVGVRCSEVSVVFLSIVTKNCAVVLIHLFSYFFWKLFLDSCFNIYG